MRSGHLDQDRAAVQRMTSEAQDFMLGRAFHLMLWGLCLALLHGAESARFHGALPLTDVMREGLFIGLAVAAAFGSYVFERYHASNPVNILLRTLLILWAAVGVALLITDFLGGVTGLAAAGPRVGGMAALIALGFTVSAGVVAWRGLVWLGLFWWGLAILFFFLDPVAADFLAAAGFLGGLFIPGVCLYGVYWQGRRLAFKNGQ